MVAEIPTIVVDSSWFSFTRGGQKSLYMDMIVSLHMAGIGTKMSTCFFFTNYMYLLFDFINFSNQTEMRYSRHDKTFNL